MNGSIIIKGFDWESTHTKHGLQRANRTIAYPDRYQVEWIAAKKKRTKGYTYLTRAETFAAIKKAAGFEVVLWDKLELKCLSF